LSAESKPTSAFILSLTGGLISFVLGLLSGLLDVELYVLILISSALWGLIAFLFGFLVIVLSILLYRDIFERDILALIIIIFSILTLSPLTWIFGIIGGMLAFERIPKVKEEGEATTKICSGCGEKISNKVKYCPECGKTQIEPKITCQKCGYLVASSMKHCPECGNKISRR